MVQATVVSRRVLLVGGPADGTWRVTNRAAIVVREVIPIKWRPGDAGDPEVPLPIEHVYHVVPITLMGYDLLVAVCDCEGRTFFEQRRAILRAILQRDVANQMKV